MQLAQCADVKQFVSSRNKNQGMVLGRLISTALGFVRDEVDSLRNKDRAIVTTDFSHLHHTIKQHISKKKLKMDMQRFSSSQNTSLFIHSMEDKCTSLFVTIVG